MIDHARLEAIMEAPYIIRGEEIQDMARELLALRALREEVVNHLYLVHDISRVRAMAKAINPPSSEGEKPADDRL